MFLGSRPAGGIHEDPRPLHLKKSCCIPTTNQLYERHVQLRKFARWQSLPVAAVHCSSGVVRALLWHSSGQGSSDQPGNRAIFFFISAGGPRVPREFQGITRCLSCGSRRASLFRGPQRSRCGKALAAPPSVRLPRWSHWPAALLLPRDHHPI